MPINESGRECFLFLLIIPASLTEDGYSVLDLRGVNDDHNYSIERGLQQWRIYRH